MTFPITHEEEQMVMFIREGLEALAKHKDSLSVYDAPSPYELDDWAVRATELLDRLFSSSPKKDWPAGVRGCGMSEKLCKGYYVVLRELTLSPIGAFLTAYPDYFATLDAAQAYVAQRIVENPSRGPHYITKVEVVAHPEVTVTVRNE